MNESIKSYTESSFTVLGKANGNLANSILDKINAFICIIDTIQLKLLWANKYLTNKLGYSVEELNKLTSYELLRLIHPDYQETLMESFKKSKSAQKKENYSVYKVLAKDCKWLWIFANHGHFEIEHSGSTRHVIVYGIVIEPAQFLNQSQKLQKIDNDLHMPDLRSILSCRQIMVLKLIAKGKTDKEIAEILYISVHTAKTHRKRIIHKLGFKNTGTLINFAVENGLG